MRIAYILPSLANKGPIIVAKDLVLTMTAHGHSCKVFYFDDIIETEFNCPVQQIKFSRTINFNEFDVVHSHGIRPDTYIWLHKPIICQAKIISTIHNFVFEDLAEQYNKLIAYTFGSLWMFILRRHNKIVTLSKTAIKYYARKLPKKKLCYAYNTRIGGTEDLTVSEQSEIQEFKSDSILIGVNALLTHRKGVDMLIKALTQLPEYKLFIVGDGKERNSLERLSMDCNVKERVHFAGYREAAYRYLPAYDIYAMPSRSEGFPLALLEAAIVSKNAVCSDLPVLKEIYNSNEIAFFELENIDSLISAIKYATNRHSLGINLHKRYEKDYSPEQFYNRYYNIYKS